jgi:GxxExxY protein
MRQSCLADESFRFHAKNREGAKIAMGRAMTVEELATVAVDCGLKLHQRLGSGLLENAYEKDLAHMLRERGLEVVTQLQVPIVIDGVFIDQGFRADIVVAGKLLIEIKSVERLHETHAKQVLTYLRLMDLPLGLLMNFGGERFSHGLKRIVNNHHDTEGSNLRVHQ